MGDDVTVGLMVDHDADGVLGGAGLGGGDDGLTAGHGDGLAVLCGLDEDDVGQDQGPEDHGRDGEEAGAAHGRRLQMVTSFSITSGRIEYIPRPG